MYLDHNVKLTLATDGVTMTDTTLSNEYLIAHTQCDLSHSQLLRCIHSGFSNAFVPEHEQMAADAVAKASSLLVLERT
jgi:adenosine deaminase